MIQASKVREGDRIKSESALKTPIAEPPRNPVQSTFRTQKLRWESNLTARVVRVSRGRAYSWNQETAMGSNPMIRVSRVDGGGV